VASARSDHGRTLRGDPESRDRRREAVVMTSTAQLCLITPTHLANSPRVVKEAITLRAAGYRVRVVCGRNTRSLDDDDLELISKHHLEVHRVDTFRHVKTLLDDLRFRMARRRRRLHRTPSLTDCALAENRSVGALLRTVHRLPRADLYLGHAPSGLAVAGDVADRHNACLGFDAEDFHSAETHDVVNNPAALHGLRLIERTYLPRCGHITAASPLIGEAYTEAYQVGPLRTVLNTFPKQEGLVSPSLRPAGHRPKLYWYSQTIGPGRGLETVIRILGNMKTPCDLDLRGEASPGFIEELKNMCRQAGYGGLLQILPRAKPDSLVTLATPYDLGLALEQTAPHNRDLCLTNKLFTYLLAGIPVAYTPTRAQRYFAAKVGDAAIELSEDEPAATAQRLDQYFATPTAQRRAREQAWKAAQSRYHWEFDARELLDSLRQALDEHRARRPHSRRSV